MPLVIIFQFFFTEPILYYRELSALRLWIIIYVMIVTVVSILLISFGISHLSKLYNRLSKTNVENIK